VRGVEAKLREMEDDDPTSKAFAATLRALMKNFDLRQYLKVLESTRNNG
jgi:hypothetical protein